MLSASGPATREIYENGARTGNIRSPLSCYLNRLLHGEVGWEEEVGAEATGLMLGGAPHGPCLVLGAGNQATL